MRKEKELTENEKQEETRESEERVTSGATKDGGHGGGLKTEHMRMEMEQYRIDADVTSLQSSILGPSWHLLKRQDLGLARGQRSMLFSV